MCSAVFRLLPAFHHAVAPKQCYSKEQTCTLSRYAQVCAAYNLPQCMPSAHSSHAFGGNSISVSLPKKLGNICLSSLLTERSG